MTTNDPIAIAAISRAFAECETLAGLREWGRKVGKEDLTDHDRRLLRATYTAKLEWLTEQEQVA